MKIIPVSTTLAQALFDVQATKNPQPYVSVGSSVRLVAWDGFEPPTFGL